MDFEVLPPKQAGRQDVSRIVAWILDDLIPIPGTKLRVGLDPIIGLIPGLGDSSTAAFSSVLLINALKAGLPRIVMVRMVLNILMNTLVGAVPVAGDLFSAWFKSNQRNYALLVEHSGRGRKSTRMDWIIVGGLLATVLAITVAISILLGWMVVKFFTLLANA